uniref:Uncharacterized protein n=1 Tax=Rhizophora mucronata TaxID=61149 RepID=A0A2P2JFY4_RHIMU
MTSRLQLSNIVIKLRLHSFKYQNYQINMWQIQFHILIDRMLSQQIKHPQ